MKRKLLLFICLWIVLLVLMIIQKFVFMAIQPDFVAEDFANIAAVISHGFTMDLSMSAYLMAPILLWLIARTWIDKPVMSNILRAYLWFISALFCIVMVVDNVLYPFWQIRLDATPVFYFTTSPKAALASMDWWWEAMAVLLTAALTWGVFLILHAVTKKIVISNSITLKNKIITTIALIITAGVMIIPIRGGVTVSTMSPGRAYFSADMRLNHAAINPMFNFVYSMTRVDNLSKTFHYMDDTKAQKIITAANETPVNSTATVSLNAPKPDIYLIILESFSAHLLPTLGGENIATNLDSIARNGILFTNFYAESFRTDRALATILSGYPALPTTSVMRYPNKFSNMPSLARELKNNGYNTYYYYGGDADFTNMKAYLVATGFDNIVSDSDFPVNQRLSKWGAPDGPVFDRALASARTSPAFTVIQTSSSHEPYDVPYQSRHTNIRANAFAYADSCLGAFIKGLKDNNRWGNALVVITPDHWGSYPKGLTDHKQRHHIPLIFTGGAISGTPQVITSIGSQSAITPTILSLLGYDTKDFFRPLNLFDKAANHYAWLTETEWFTIIDKEGGETTGSVANKSVNGVSPDFTKAYIQTIYTDLDRR